MFLSVTIMFLEGGGGLRPQVDSICLPCTPFLFFFSFSKGLACSEPHSQDFAGLLPSGLFNKLYVNQLSRCYPPLSKRDGAGT